MTDAPFDFAFAVGIVDATGQRDGAVMVQYIPVEMIDGGVVDVRRKHTFAEVIENDCSRDAAESAEGFLVQFRPDLRTGAEHQEPDAFAAVAESQNEKPAAAIFTGLRITDHGPGTVIHLRLFTGGGFDDGARFRCIAAADLEDEASDALITGGEVIDVDQILPNGFRIAASR